MKLPQAPTLSAATQHFVFGVLIFIGLLLVLSNFYFPMLPAWTVQSLGGIAFSYLLPHFLAAFLLYRWNREVGTGYIVGMLGTLLLMGLVGIELYFHPLEIYL